jgi:MFS family permease
MLTSVCNKYYQFLLNQGLLGGISNGLAYTPAVAMVGQYFHARRPLAMGIASSGSAIGGVLFPIILNRLLNHTTLGFGWTLRVVGFLVLALCIVACLTVVPRANVPRRKGKYLLWKAWKKPSYVLQAAGLFLVYWGLFTPFFYLPAYGSAHGLDPDMAIYTISILNTGSFFGRLLSGYLAPLVGKFNLLALSSLVSSLLIFCWLRITSTASIIVFAVLYGFSSGFIIALTPTTLAALAEHPNEIGSYVGMAMGVIGLAALTGAPITGAMISRFGGYNEAMIFSGVVIFAGSILVFGARLVFEKRRVWAA